MKKSYLKPQVEALVLSVASLVCDSPKPGENENIQYVDWEL